MKKTIKALFTLVLFFSLTFLLTSCGPRPKFDLDDAKDNLEDANYTVYYTDDEEKLSTNVEEQLSAFTNDDYIYITKYKDFKSASLAYKKLKLEYQEEINEYELEIKELKLQLKELKNYLAKYEDELDRDEIRYIEDEIEELEDEIEECKDDLKDFKDTYTVGKIGKYVWEGTKDATSDTK